MSPPVALLLLVVLLPLSCLLPGYALARRLGLRPLETLAGSAAISVVLLYLLATAVYLTRVPWAWCWSAPASGLAVIVCWRNELRRRVAAPAVRKTLIAFAALFLLLGLVLALVRHYSGGGWGGDWYEHAQRARFFLLRLDADTVFEGGYVLPARPPLMNLLEAAFLAMVGDTFAAFQVVALFLNLLVFFPCALLAGLLTREGVRRLPLVAAVLALSPFVVENSVYPWTKLHSAFFVLLATALYVRGWQRHSSVRIVVAAGSMAAGLLAHYSAGPYAVALGLHYAWTFARRAWPWREAALAALVAAALLSSWFAWSTAVFGLGTTVASNTTVAESQNLPVAANALKIARNIFHTFVPHPLHLSPAEFETQFVQPNLFGSVRDRFFLVYQTTLPFLFGLSGGIVATVLALRALRTSAPPLAGFWMLFVPMGVLLGIAVHGTPDVYGVAHICLQPIGLLGLVLIATRWPALGRGLRTALLAGISVDVVAGIVLQMRMQMAAIAAVERGGELVVPLRPGLLSVTAVGNALTRQIAGATFLGDLVAGAAPLLALLAVAGFCLAAARLAHDSPRRDRPRRPRFSPALLVVGTIAIGSAWCFADRRLGYDPAAASDGPVAAQSAVDRALFLLERQPHDPRAHHALGAALLEAGNVREAAAAFAEAFLLEPQARLSRYALGLLQNMHGAAPEDVPLHALDVLREHPVHLEATITVAWAQHQRGHSTTAVQTLRAAAAAHPQSADVHELLAVILHANGDHAEAILAARQALARAPASLEIEQRLRAMLAGQGLDRAAADRVVQEVRRIGK